MRGVVRCLLVALMWIPGVCFGQTSGESQPDAASRAAGVLSPQAQFRRSSLLDPSKFSMTQSYTMAMSAGALGSGATGLYMNTLSYRLSPNMWMRLHLGVQHGWTPVRGDNGQAGQARLIPGFDWTYRPAQNMRFEVSYRTYTPHMNSHYGSRRSLFGNGFSGQDASRRLWLDPFDSADRDEER